MITDQDVEKLKKTFVTKDYLNKELDRKIDQMLSIMVTKSEIHEVKEDIKELRFTNNKIFVILDGLAKKFDFHDMEYTALKMSDDRQNEQIHQLAKHTKYRFGV